LPGVPVTDGSHITGKRGTEDRFAIMPGLFSCLSRMHANIISAGRNPSTSREFRRAPSA
jgi:hypothetical protein